MTDQPTTQEVEKALGTLERCRDLMASGITVSPQQYRAILDDFNAALGSLRTQLEQVTKERDDYRAMRDAFLEGGKR